MNTTSWFDGFDARLESVGDKTLASFSGIADVGVSLAALGALFFIAYRVWSFMSRGESVDVFSLLKPFALLLCILNFNTFVLGSLDLVLNPIIHSMDSVVEENSFTLRKKNEELERQSALRSNQAYLVDDDLYEEKLKELDVLDFEGRAGIFFEKKAYDLKLWVVNGTYDVLDFLFNVVSLIIKVVRKFYLVILGIIGPIVFGFAVWDGFGHGLVSWLNRYISVSLWLPVLSIVHSMFMQLNIQELDKDLMDDGGFFLEGFLVKIMFRVFGIVCMLSVPTLAGWIVEAGGMSGVHGKLTSAASRGAATGGKALLNKLGSRFKSKGAGGASGAGASGAAAAALHAGSGLSGSEGGKGDGEAQKA